MKEAQTLCLCTIGNAFEELRRNYPAAQKKMEDVLGAGEYAGELAVKSTKESKDNMIEKVLHLQMQCKMRSS